MARDGLRRAPMQSGVRRPRGMRRAGGDRAETGPPTIARATASPPSSHSKETVMQSLSIRARPARARRLVLALAAGAAAAADAVKGIEAALVAAQQDSAASRSIVTARRSPAR
jgi:hypothetical protein